MPKLSDTDSTLASVPNDVIETVADRLMTIHERSRVTISNVIAALLDQYPALKDFGWLE